MLSHSNAEINPIPTTTLYQEW